MDRRSSAAENVDHTVAALLDSQSGVNTAQPAIAREVVKARLADAASRLKRLRGAIEAGVDPVALVESINDAQAQSASAKAELDAVATGPTCSPTPRSTR